MPLLFTNFFYLPIFLPMKIEKILNDRKKKTTLTNEQKKEIIEYKEKHEKLTNVFIASFFSKKFKTKIDSRSVGNYIKDAKKIISHTYYAPNMTKGQVLKFPSIDEYMDAYIYDIEAKSGFINDFLIMKKAELDAKKSGIGNFSAKKGWLEKFKRNT